MEKIKAFLANTIVKWYKHLGFAGAARWRLLYWAYKITGWHIRHKEWDWVLNYLPPLAKWQKVSVLDVGCTSSLFPYELQRRGYRVTGVDLQSFQEVPTFDFCMADICTFCDGELKYNFITCISVLEHILPDKQNQAMKNMLNLLKPGGRLLMTIPTKEYAQGHPWEGFDYSDINFDNREMRILEYTERAGQICVAIGKL